MRDYSKVSSSFWTGSTGKKIKAAGRDAQVVAFYLMTTQHANMLGLFYLPVAYLSHDTGIPFEGASEALRRVENTGFCRFDPESEWVWVTEMAKWQILAPDQTALSPRDNRVKGIQKDYASLPNNPFLRDFFDRYKDAFHLEIQRGKGSPEGKGLGRGFEAPTKPGTGTGTGEKEKTPPVSPPSEKPAGGSYSVKGLDFTDWPATPSTQVLGDWIELRKKQRAPITQTVITSFGRQMALAAQAGRSVDECLSECVCSGWRGFKAAWMANRENRNAPGQGPRRLSAVERAHAAEQRIIDGEARRVD